MFVPKKYNSIERFLLVALKLCQFCPCWYLQVRCGLIGTLRPHPILTTEIIWKPFRVAGAAQPATPYHLNLEKQSQTLAKANKETMRPPWPFGTNQFFGWIQLRKKIIYNFYKKFLEPNISSSSRTNSWVQVRFSVWLYWMRSMLWVVFLSLEQICAQMTYVHLHMVKKKNTKKTMYAYKLQHSEQEYLCTVSLVLK